MACSLTNQWFLCSSASGVEEDPLSVAQRNTNVSAAAAAAFLSPDASISSSRHLTQTGWQCRGQRPPSWLGRSNPKRREQKEKKESQEHNSKLQGNRSNPINLPKKSPMKIMLVSTCVLPFQIPGGDLFLLLAGGGDEEDEECEDRTSSEQHRFAADAAVVLAALVRTLPITSCCISL